MPQDRITQFQQITPSQGGGLSLGNSIPLANGTPSAGTSSQAAREDHIHPKDNNGLTLVQLADIFFPINSAERYPQLPGAREPKDVFPGTQWQIDTSLAGRSLIGSGNGYSFGASGGSPDAVAVKHGGHVRPNNDSSGTNNAEVPLSSNSYYLPIGSVVQYGNNRTFMLEFGNEVGFRTRYQGEDGKGKNMPPYLVINYWKRIG